MGNFTSADQTTLTSSKIIAKNIEAFRLFFAVQFSHSTVSVVKFPVIVHLQYIRASLSHRIVTSDLNFIIGKTISFNFDIIKKKVQIFKNDRILKNSLEFEKFLPHQASKGFSHC